MDNIVDMYINGKSVKAIAAAHDMTTAAVREVLKQAELI